MPAHLLLRLSSQLTHIFFSSVAVFCLHYAAKNPNHQAAMVLSLYAIEYGAVASIIVYCHGKYLSNV